MLARVSDLLPAWCTFATRITPPQRLHAEDESRYFHPEASGQCPVVIDEAYHHFAGKSGMYVSFLDQPVHDDKSDCYPTFSKDIWFGGFAPGLRRGLARRLSRKCAPSSPATVLTRLPPKWRGSRSTNPGRSQHRGQTQQRRSPGVFQCSHAAHADAGRFPHEFCLDQRAASRARSHRTFSPAQDPDRAYIFRHWTITSGCRSALPMRCRRFGRHGTCCPGRRSSASLSLNRIPGPSLILPARQARRSVRPSHATCRTVFLPQQLRSTPAHCATRSNSRAGNWFPDRTEPKKCLTSISKRSRKPPKPGNFVDIWEPCRGTRVSFLAVRYLPQPSAICSRFIWRGFWARKHWVSTPWA